MTAPRLLVITQRELTRDVRARRQVEAALHARLDVEGLCTFGPGESALELDSVRITRVPGDRLSNALRRRGLGGMRRSRRPARELRGMWRLVRFVRTNALLALAARHAGRFDAVHANDFDVLPAAYLLARRSRARLVYDADELYRFMESDPPRLWTALASALEGWLARRADVVMTNCDLFAAELCRFLRLEHPAVVVLNCPDPIPDLPPPPPPERRLRVIYQAAADYEAKPLADLIEAAAGAPDVDVTMRVVDVDRRRVEAEIARRGLADRVRISDPVPPDRLVDGLVGFDAGVIINRETTPNSSLSTPNKLWEHMMAGIATVAPALPGLRVIDKLGVGATFEPGRPNQLGQRLQQLADDRGALSVMQARARELALERFNSTVQEEALRTAWGLPG